MAKDTSFNRTNTAINELSLNETVDAATLGNALRDYGISINDVTSVPDTSPVTPAVPNTKSPERNLD